MRARQTATGRVCVCARLHCLCVNVASEVMRDSTEVIPEVLL